MGHALPVCSGYVPWFDRLKAAFSNKQNYELDFLSWYSGRRCSKLVKFFVVLIQANSYHQLKFLDLTGAVALFRKL